MTKHVSSRTFFRDHLPELVGVLWGCCLIAASIYLACRSNPLLKIGGLDPVFYFANAHSLLFDHDYDLRNELSRLKLPPELAVYPGHNGVNGLPGSPWAVGYSLITIPFLAAGTAIDEFCGQPADGYGRIATVAYLSANSFLVASGLLCLMQFLRKCGASRWAACSVSLVMWFSTTLSYYTFAAMSHAATFAATSAFLLVWSRVRHCPKTGPWLALGICGGITSICRWQDGAFLVGVLLVDLADHSFSVRKWSAFAGGFSLAWIPQIIQWHTVYGKYLTMPYGYGFSDFPPRHIIEVLFSTNHGWISWTPVVVIGLFGLVLDVRCCWPWLVVVIIEVSVVGSLRIYWHGADSFGSRMLTSCVPLIALGVSQAIKRAAGWGKFAVGSAIFVCAAYSMLFALQFSLHRIPQEGTLTIKQVFWDKLEVAEYLLHAR